MAEEEGPRIEFEERDGRRLKFVAGQPGKYVGVTERKGKMKTSFYARACITKRKGDKRRQYAINGCFTTAVAAAIAIAAATAVVKHPLMAYCRRLSPLRLVMQARA